MRRPVKLTLTSPNQSVGAYEEWSAELRAEKIQPQWVTARQVSPKLAGSTAYTQHLAQLKQASQIANAVAHPQVRHCLGWLETEADSFQLMEPLSGIRLSALLDIIRVSKCPIPSSGALWISRSIAAALAHADFLGFQHGDLSLPCIHLTSVGEIKVDFGLTTNAEPVPDKLRWVQLTKDLLSYGSNTLPTMLSAWLEQPAAEKAWVEIEAEMAACHYSLDDSTNGPKWLAQTFETLVAAEPTLSDSSDSSLGPSDRPKTVSGTWESDIQPSLSKTESPTGPTQIQIENQPSDAHSKLRAPRITPSLLRWFGLGFTITLALLLLFL